MSNQEPKLQNMQTVKFQIRPLTCHYLVLIYVLLFCIGVAFVVGVDTLIYLKRQYYSLIATRYCMYNSHFMFASDQIILN